MDDAVVILERLANFLDVVASVIHIDVNEQQNLHQNIRYGLKVFISKTRLTFADFTERYVFRDDARFYRETSWPRNCGFGLTLPTGTVVL